jgi:hypothetical protein
MTNEYHGPCTILLDRSTTVDVRRGGKVETVAMPSVDTPHDEPSGVATA